MDDFTDDISTTEVLPVGGFVFGEIETLGDEDWFRIEQEAGRQYFFEIVGRAVAPYTLEYADIVLFDEFGLPVTSTGSTGSGYGTASDTNLTHLAEVSGTYFISAQSSERVDIPIGPPIGTYRLTFVEQVPEVEGREDDNGDGRLTATPLPAEDRLYARNFGGNDQDWFLVSPEAGTSYLAELTHTEFTSLPNDTAILRLVGDDGFLINSSTRPGGDGPVSQLSFSAGTDDPLYVVARNTGNFPGAYSVTLSELPDLSFSDGADWLTLPTGLWPGLLDIRGGAGRDTMSFAGHGAGVEVNLATGLARAAGDAAFSILMDGIENVTGTSFDDTLYGREGAEVIRGLGGNDTVYGSAGADRLDGGGGRDAVSYLFSDTGVSASLLRGKGWSGDAAGDRLSGFETLVGSYHDDVLWGDHRDNRLEGSTGDDTLVGNGGDDYILAGLGVDVVVYSGNRADYTIARDGIRTDVIHNGWEGHDILGHAEVLRFADGDVLVSDLPMG